MSAFPPLTVMLSDHEPLHIRFDDAKGDLSYSKMRGCLRAAIAPSNLNAGGGADRWGRPHGACAGLDGRRAGDRPIAGERVT
jgi:hypothetical protein